MAKGKTRGRPRKDGERYPCGKLKKVGGEGVSPAQWQRIRTDAVKLTGDQRLCSEVGRLSFHGELTARQSAAAFRVASIYGAFEALHGKRRYARSPSYEVGMRSTSFLTDDQRAELEFDTEVAFRELQAQVPSYPADIRALLEQLCVENRAVNSARLPEIRWLLDEMSNFFRLGSAKSKDKKIEIPKIDRKPAAKPKRKNSERDILIMAIGKLRPDLDDKQISQAVAFCRALNDRADFRNQPGFQKRVKLNLISDNYGATPL